MYLQEQKLYAGHIGTFLGSLKFHSFKKGIMMSFVLICHFDSSRSREPWRFALADGMSWKNDMLYDQKCYGFYGKSFFSMQREMSLSIRKQFIRTFGRRVILSPIVRDQGDERFPEYQSVDIRFQ